MHVCGILQSTWRTAGSRNLCGIYSRSSAIYIMQQYIPQKYTKFRLIHFGSVLNCQYRSIQAQVSIFQHSTIAALYKKRPRGVQRGAALCPFAVFSHSNVIYPLRASTVYVPYSRSSAIYAVYTAGSPQSILCNNISYRNIQSSV